MTPNLYLCAWAIHLPYTEASALELLYHCKVEKNNYCFLKWWTVPECRCLETDADLILLSLYLQRKYALHYKIALIINYLGHCISVGALIVAFMLFLCLRWVMCLHVSNSVGWCFLGFQAPLMALSSSWMVLKSGHGFYVPEHIRGFAD